MALTFLKVVHGSVIFCNILQLHLSSVSSWLDSGYVFLAGVLQKCHSERGVCLYHYWWWDFGYLRWYMPDLSTVRSHLVIPTVVVFRWDFWNPSFCLNFLFRILWARALVCLFLSPWTDSVSKCLINYIRHYLAFVCHVNIYRYTLYMCKRELFKTVVTQNPF